MSMGQAPCHGHVKAATPELLAFLGITPDKVKDLLEELGAGTNPKLNPLESVEVLEDLYRSGHTELEFRTEQGKTVSFFLYDSDNGDIYDDLKNDTLYVLFDESDLYIKKPSEFLTQLKEAGFEPEESSWTVFG